MNFNKWMEWLRSRLRSDAGLKWIFGIGLAGIALIFLSGLRGTAKGKENPAQSTSSSPEYAAQLEEKLTTLISSIDGVGGCRVLVTLENGVKYQYAQEEKNEFSTAQDGTSGRTTQENNTQRSYVVFDSDSDGKQPLIITECAPEVKGVVVVCAGARDVQVRQRVTEVVTTALALSTIQVCVVPMS